ncbi:hypothetical protein [Oleomonas cavernae]|nr:hypothetical protein [Oleomonas cavernae]
MRDRSLRQAAGALALGLAVLASALPAQAQQGPTPLMDDHGVPVPRLAPGERTRAILQMQNATSAGRRPTVGGAESQKQVDNYLASIGKGGAGPVIEGIGEGAAFTGGGN